MITTVKQALEKHENEIKIVSQASIKKNDMHHFENWTELETLNALSNIPILAKLPEFRIQLLIINERFRRHTRQSIM